MCMDLGATVFLDFKADDVSRPLPGDWTILQYNGANYSDID